MEDGQSIPVKRLRVPCGDLAEFHRRFAPVFARRGVFVASESPDPVGTHVRLRLELKLPGSFVSGEAVVDRHSVGKRRGAYFKFLRLDPGSLELEARASETPASGRAGLTSGEAEALSAALVAGDPEATRAESGESGRSADGSLGEGGCCGVEAAARFAAVTAELPSVTVVPAVPEPCPAYPWENEQVELVSDLRKRPQPGLQPITAVESPRAKARQRTREQQPVSEPVPREETRHRELVHDLDLWAGGLRPFDTLGNYQLLVRLGGGGMAEVFLARSTLGQGVEKIVAFKVVLPEFGPDTRYASLFLNEARISATLQHPNLIQVFGLGEAVARPYLAMEYVHGRTLGELLARLRELGRRPPLGFAAGVALELCKALEYVHGKRELDGRRLNLVHRDVSSGNVLVSERGEVKLVDFGVASDSSRVDELGGVVVGKAGYMSPEQARGETPAPGWDLFALGMLLREMLAASDSGDAGDDAATAQARALLERAVLWAIEPDPARRVPSAQALRELLERVLLLLPAFGVGSLMSELFGEELVLEQRRIEALISHARRVMPPRRVTGTMPLLRPLRAVRRRLAATRLFLKLWRRRRAVALVGAALLAAVGLTGTLGWKGHQREAALAGQLSRADAQLRVARLVSPAGDGALELLLQARAAFPGEPRVELRLTTLADSLEGLGRAAEARGNLAEAAVHYQGALAADPSRGHLRPRIVELNEAVRARAVGRER